MFYRKLLGEDVRTHGGVGVAGARKGTSMKILKAMSDRLLKLFLSDVSAGACVPENGTCCRKGSGKYFNCYGSCVKSSVCP